MRKILLIFLYCCFVLPAMAQSSFSWGLNLYPNFSNRRLLNSGGTLSNRAIIQLDSLEKASFSYSAGLDAAWRGEKLGLNLGLRYMTTGYQTIRMIVLPDDPDSDFANESTFALRQHNIEIPVEVLFFQDLSDKNALFFMLGTSFNYNLQSSLERTLYSEGGTEKIPEEPDYEWRKFNYAFQTGMGWQHKLSPSLLLSVQPTFQFWIKPIYEDRADVNRNLYNLGIKVGFRFINKQTDY